MLGDQLFDIILLNIKEELQNLVRIIYGTYVSATFLLYHRPRMKSDKLES